jgi:hypothetical protein
MHKNFSLSVYLTYSLLLQADFLTLQKFDKLKKLFDIQEENKALQRGIQLITRHNKHFYTNHTEHILQSQTGVQNGTTVAFATNSCKDGRWIMFRTFGEKHYFFVFKWGGRSPADGIEIGELIQVSFDASEGNTEWLTTWVHNPGSGVSYELTISDAASGLGRNANDWALGDLYEFTIGHLEVMSNCVLAGKYLRSEQKFYIDPEYLSSFTGK